MLSYRGNKFPWRLELINANVETARNDLSVIHDIIHRKYDVKPVCGKFRYCHCCVSVIMPPADYLTSAHVAYGAIWVETPDVRHCRKGKTPTYLLRYVPKQPALHFWGGSFHDISWHHRAYSTVVQFFHKRSQIKLSSQHLWKWELFSLIKMQTERSGQSTNYSKPRLIRIRLIQIFANTG